MHKFGRGLAFIWLLACTLGMPVRGADTVLSIAMVQWRGETEACRGFKAGLEEMGYAARYTVLDAGQDRSTLGRLLRAELMPNLDGFDYVYSYGTTASQMTKTILDNRVPHVFSNVAAPVESGITPSMQSSGANISGTSNRVPLALQVEIARRAIPFQRLGIMFNPREKNAGVIREELYALGRKHGFEVVDLRSVPDTDSLERNLRELTSGSVRVDAVYLPLDSYHMTRSKQIGQELRAARIATIAAQKTYITDGALLGAVPDYYALGKEVARIIDRHRRGEALKSIAIATPSQPLVMFNRTTARALAIELPAELSKGAVIVE